MSTQTLSKECVQAVEHFQSKLAFETGPVGVKQSLEKGAPLQIVDLRTPELYAKGHIPKAINILYEDLEKNLGHLKKDVPTIVYCYSITCNLSTKAALWLAKNGYPVQELVGGWQEWVNLGFKAESKDSGCSTHSHHSCG